MIKATSFNFTSYQFTPSKKRIVFKYQIELLGQVPLDFTETITLPKVPSLKNISPEMQQQVLQGLHLVLGLSYYKLYCPGKVKIPYKLTRQQADFWGTVYKNGLGELYYRNKLDPKKSPKFPHDQKAVVVGSYLNNRKQRALVGIGGGKDSIVVAERLKKHHQEFISWVMETEKPSPVIETVVKAIGVGELKIKRQLDKKIFSKWPDAYNGHIPISAIIAWLGLLTALLYDYSEIIVGNEYSSSFGNIKYRGLEVNHQWSKSAEFEKMFQDYVKNFITPDIKYFSLLRQFHEIRVVRDFASLRKYHQLFSSCNGNFKVNKERNKILWCGKCPKCAFVFAQLAAWLPKSQVVKIFGKNLFADEQLLDVYKDLLGAGTMKPFECVGTFEETQVAMFLASSKFQQDYIIKQLKPIINKGKNNITKVLGVQAVESLPPSYRLMGLDNVLILGYGREGQVTEKYLQRFYPGLKIGIADQSLTKNYLALQGQYEFAIKTPGISKRVMTVPYTTATNLFLAQVKQVIIGVTGSKGKSTTASLIYDMLRAGGLKVRLVGNIGKPMLETLMKPIRLGEVFVIELSSYQLDDIEYSPRLAVITNLFPEHMNYHGGLAPYYEAKKNIINFQRPQDFYFYNPHDKKQLSWVKTAKAKALPFDRKIPVAVSEIPLLGQHNQENIRAAMTVARMFNVTDKQIALAIKNFKSLPHRLARVGRYRGVEFYDDAISTTPQSTIEAIRALKRVETIFLGGEDRGYDFKGLEKILRQYKIKNVVLFPDSGRRILKSRSGFNVLETASMKTAVRFAYRYTAPGKICLLSTASPSYSLWKDFEEKGGEFIREIKRNNQK